MFSCPGGRVLWQFRPDRLAAQQVRQAAARWLSGQGVVSVDDALLVIAELLANAIRVAEGIVTLEVTVTATRVQITVTDDGGGLKALPSAELPSDQSEGGRGLYLVRMLSCDLLVDTVSTGTSIRCWVPLREFGALAT